MMRQTSPSESLVEDSWERTMRGTGEAAIGLYAFYAVAALTGTSMTRSGWLAVGALSLLLSVLSAGAKTVQWQRRLWFEPALILGAIFVGGLLPGWSAGWGIRIGAVLVARGLAGLFRGTARVTMKSLLPSAAEYLRLTLLFTLASLTLHAYLSPTLVGPKDARWYGNAVIDFLAQMRAGTFPVFSGETFHAFNGVIQTFRSAPWLLYYSGLIDVVTLRSLTPLAVEHVALITSYTGAVMVFYISLVRLRPSARWIAFLLAAIYAASPAIMTPLTLHDMYMTAMAVPVLVLVLFATAHAIETQSLRSYVWLGMGCAAMWLCHPPLAFLGMAAAGFCLAAKFAIEPPAVRPVVGGIFFAVVFAALAAPYFYAMMEVPPTHFFDPLPNLGMPAFALFLLILALMQTLRSRGIRWLALLPTVWYTLHTFKPSLLPFAWIFLGLFTVVAATDYFWPKLSVRSRPEPWLLTIFLAASASATFWFPTISLPAKKFVVGAVGPALTSPWAWVQLMIRGGDSQPHAIWWIIGIIGIFLVWRTRSQFARLAFAAAVVGIMAIAPVPLIKLFIWSNTTVEIWDVLNAADWLRFWPFTMPLLLFAVFPMLAELDLRRWGARLVIGGLFALLPWALWDHAKIVRTIFVWPEADSARFYRPENAIMQSYSWDLLRMPQYYSSGVMDPRMEIRLWSQRAGRELLLDPDLIAQDLEKKNGGVRLNLKATQDPTYPQWVYLEPKIDLLPGEHKLLRFDFHGRQINGWLILRGQQTYRDYIMPSSGLERSFGTGPLNTRTVSLWNSGVAPEHVEIVVKREGPNANAPIFPQEFPDVVVTTFDSSKSAVAVKSLSPLKLRVDAPQSGMLELFRSDLPGYRVWLNGKSVPHSSSREGLIALAIPAGTNELTVQFRGTWQLRDLFWYGLLAWTVAFVYLIYEWARAGGLFAVSIQPSRSDD